MHETLLNEFSNNNDKKKLGTVQVWDIKPLSSNTLNANVLFTDNLTTNNITTIDQIFLNTWWIKKFPPSSSSADKALHKFEQTQKYNFSMSASTWGFNLTSKINLPRLYLDKTQTTIVTSILLRADTRLKSAKVLTLFVPLPNSFNSLTQDDVCTTVPNNELWEYPHLQKIDEQNQEMYEKLEEKLIIQDQKNEFYYNLFRRFWNLILWLLINDTRQPLFSERQINGVTCFSNKINISNLTTILKIYPLHYLTMGFPILLWYLQRRNIIINITNPRLIKYYTYQYKLVESILKQLGYNKVTINLTRRVWNTFIKSKFKKW